MSCLKGLVGLTYRIMRLSNLKGSSKGSLKGSIRDLRAAQGLIKRSWDIVTRVIFRVAILINTSNRQTLNPKP